MQRHELGERKATVLGSGRSPFCREKRKGERKREQHVGSHKKNTTPKPLTGDLRETDYHRHLQTVELNSEVLEICVIHWSQARWAAVLLGRRRMEAQEWTVWCRVALGHTGRKCSPFWSTFGKVYIATQRTKDPPGTIEQPVNSRQREAHAEDR